MVSRAAEQQRRILQVSHDVLGHRPEDKPPESRPPVSRHYNQVAPQISRDPDDDLARHALYDTRRGTAHTSGFKRVTYLADVRSSYLEFSLNVRVQRRQQLYGTRCHGDRPPKRQPVRAWHDRPQDYDVRSVLSRNGASVDICRFGKR